MHPPDSSAVAEAAADLETLVREYIKARAKQNASNAFMLGAAAGGLTLLTPVAALGFFLAPPFLANGFRAMKYAANIRTPISTLVRDGFVSVVKDGVYCQLQIPPDQAAGLVYIEEPLREKPETYLQNQAIQHQLAVDILQQRQDILSTLLHKARQRELYLEEQVAQQAEQGLLGGFFDHFWEALMDLPSLYFKGVFPKTLVKEEVEELAIAEAWYGLLQTTTAYGQEFLTWAEECYGPSLSPELQALLTVCQHHSQRLANASARLLKTSQSLRLTEERQYVMTLELHR